MNIRIIYATNSGATMTAAQSVNDTFVTKGQHVSMVEARLATIDDFKSPQVIVLGSPSWDFDGKEGMPHEDFLTLIDKVKTVKIPEKPFAVFGLGDSTFAHFCGAVDHLEKFVGMVGGKLIVPSLKVDNFFNDMDGNTEKITKWAQQVAGALQ
jgi:flavodoxin I